VGRDGAGYRSDLGQAETGIFLQMGLDTKLAGQPVGQITLNGFNKSRRLSHKNFSGFFCSKGA
jgi:hypothetical protein